MKVLGRQPKTMYFTVILCSIGAAVKGWDQTGSNGPLNMFLQLCITDLTIVLQVPIFLSPRSSTYRTPSTWMTQIPSPTQTTCTTSGLLV